MQYKDWIDTSTLLDRLDNRNSNYSGDEVVLTYCFHEKICGSDVGDEHSDDLTEPGAGVLMTGVLRPDDCTGSVSIFPLFSRISVTRPSVLHGRGRVGTSGLS